MNYTTEQLYQLKADLRAQIRVLEKRGRLRTTQENTDLKQLRAALRSVRKRLSERVTQLRLF